jgi:hypothetical protein
MASHYDNTKPTISKWRALADPSVLFVRLKSPKPWLPTLATFGKPSMSE